MAPLGRPFNLPAASPCGAVSLVFDSEAMYNMYNAGSSENPWLDRVNVQEHKLPGFCRKYLLLECLVQRGEIK